MKKSDIHTKIEFISPEGTIEETGCLIQVIIPIKTRDDGYKALETIQASLTTRKQPLTEERK